MRVNVSLPDELYQALRERCPELNVSAVVQDALRALIDCQHDRGARCTVCAATIDLDGLTMVARSAAWRLVWEAIGDGVRAGWTMEGLARVARDRAMSHGVAEAQRWPLPRLTNAARALQRDTPVELETVEPDWAVVADRQAEELAAWAERYLGQSA
jgi:Arc/MetJ-type ribon-helix-helix transcriptional regulator